MADASALAPVTYRENSGWSLFAAFNDAWATAMRAAEAPSAVPADQLAAQMEHGEKGAAMWGRRPRGYLPVFLRSLLRPE